PEYKPHVTLAYVKPGKGAKYAGQSNALTGREITINSLLFSGRGGQELNIPLKGAPTPTERAIPETPAAKEAEVVKPWEMTREQIEEEFQRKKAEDDNVDVAVLGPELAKKYARLQRQANSMYDTEKADRASAEIERIEASLSER